MPSKGLCRARRYRPNIRPADRISARVPHSSMRYQPHIRSRLGHSKPLGDGRVAVEEEDFDSDRVGAPISRDLALAFTGLPPLAYAPSLFIAVASSARRISRRLQQTFAAASPELHGARPYFAGLEAETRRRGITRTQFGAGGRYGCFAMRGRIAHVCYRAMARTLCDA
jgi:hypothetical protein